MNRIVFNGVWILLVCFFVSCSSLPKVETMEDVIEKGLSVAKEQALLMARELEAREGELPKSIKDGKLETSNCYWWCSGFFPGEVWYLYEYYKDPELKKYAELYTKRLEEVQYVKSNHDVGFMLYCSYGNGYRLTNNAYYKDVLVQGARSLSTRYNPTVQAIRSWGNGVSDYLVIIDNMMNLELLFWAARNGGGQYLYDIACKHAETTMKHQFRKDYSCYHVAVYDTLDGHFIKGVTHQGLSDDSMWARGQAWAIYGYTMVYRETHDVRFLDFARKVSDVYLSRIPEDMIPYWDFNAPELSSGEPKDASASAITASALLELSTYINDSDSAFFYRNKAVEMLQILSSPAYQARNKKDAFLLHSVGHMNKGWEVDASISYADYYYLEALVRLKRLKEKQSVLANL